MNVPSTTPPPLPLPLSAKALRTQDSPINSLIAAKLANPELVNFAAGLVDEGTLPVAEVGRITRGRKRRRLVWESVASVGGPGANELKISSGDGARRSACRVRSRI